MKKNENITDNFINGKIIELNQILAENEHFQFLLPAEKEYLKKLLGVTLGIKKVEQELKEMNLLNS